MMVASQERWREIANYSKVELLNTREEIFKLEQEIATRSVVATGVSGVMLTFLLNSFGANYVLPPWFLTAVWSIAGALLFSLLSLIRSRISPRNLPQLLNEFEMNSQWTATHVHNLLISENNDFRKRRVNCSNRFSSLALLLLIFGTLIFLIGRFGGF